LWPVLLRGLNNRSNMLTKDWLRLTVETPAPRATHLKKLSVSKRMK
jgi:hypothetical protein